MPITLNTPADGVFDASQSASTDALFNTVTVGSGLTGLQVRSWVGGNLGALYSTAVVPAAGNYALISSGAQTILNSTASTELRIGSLVVGVCLSTGLTITGTFASTAPATLSSGYTVATLPAGTVGQRAYVTDALTPVWGSAVVGAGAVTVPVFRNATVWIVG